MPTGMVIDVLRSLASDPDREPDGELVTRFAQSRDPAAFAELVRRHGPTIFGVCRRVLGHAQDAEDAFQAVWLVLARRAADVRPPGAVGPWLYGVAVRTATKARALAMKRRHRQLAAAKPEAVEDAPAAADLGPVLDEELARLPERYRRAVVACDLNGRSRSQAARDLGWPEGTVAARVAKGRELLAARLRRRGVTLSSAALAAVLASAARADLPPALAANAVAAALEFAAGSASASVPPVSVVLAEGVMRAMSASRWKLPAVVLMTAGLAAGGAVLAATAGPPATPRDPDPVRPTAVAKAAPVPTGPTWREQKVLDHPGWLVGSVAYSPDGKTLVVGGTGGKVAAYDAAELRRRWDADVGGDFTAVAVAPDGKSVAATFTDGVRFLDAASGKVGDTLEEKGSNPRVVAFFPEQPVGDTGLTAKKVIFGNLHQYFVKTWIQWPNVSGSGLTYMPAEKAPPDPHAVPLAVDPAGKRAVTNGPIDRDTGKSVFWAWSAGSGEANHVFGGHTAPVLAAAWSKDGKTIVSGDARGTVIVWDAETFQEKGRTALSGRVAAVAVSTDGTWAAAAVAGEAQVFWQNVYVWRPTALRATDFPTKLSYHGGGGPFEGTAGLAFAPDGKTLAAAFCNVDDLTKLGVLVGKVRVWELTPEK
jgi:RNA polymerase sigma factor (sigma-70 family)